VSWCCRSMAAEGYKLLVSTVAQGCMDVRSLSWDAGIFLSPGRCTLLKWRGCPQNVERASRRFSREPTRKRPARLVAPSVPVYRGWFAAWNTGVFEIEWAIPGVRNCSNTTGAAWNHYNGTSAGAVKPNRTLERDAQVAIAATLEERTRTLKELRLECYKQTHLA